MPLMGRRPYTDQQFLVAFWDRAERDTKTGCLVWTGSTMTGYPEVMFNGRKCRGHRVAWLLTRGPIPPGLFVCHQCDNRLCINPEHLFVGTARDNNLDMDRKGRRRSGWQLGEQRYNAVLTEKLVLEIRRIYREENISAAKIAARFGLGQATVSAVIWRHNWRHLP
jgi:hypothetical protein